MAESSRQLDPIPGNQPSSPKFGPDELKDIEESSVGQPASPASSSTAPGQASFNSGKPPGYSPPVTSSSTSAGKASYSSSGDLPAAERSLYNSSSTKSGRTRFGNFLGTRRRKAAAGGGLIAVIIGVLFGISIIQGPAQLLQLSHILQRTFSHNQYTITLRNKGLFRFARSGQVEETRLGKLGSIVYNRTLTQLEDQGITFQKNSSGIADKMTLDASKNDSYKDLSPSEQRTAIIEDFNITDSSTITQNGSVFEVRLSPNTWQGIDFVKATAKTAIGSLNNGSIENALAIRYVKQAWDLPSLFSPLQKARAVISSRFATPSAEKQANDQADQERLAAEEAVVADSPEALAAKGALGRAIDASQSLLTKTLLATAGLCAIRAAADAAVTVNRAVIVLPSTVQSVDKVAVGDQVESGQNFDLSQAGAVTDGFTDSSGKSIWQGKALQALEGVPNPTGTDLPSEYAQAFSGKTTADNIRNYIKVTDPIFHKDITDLACSQAGQVFQFVLAVILLANSLDTLGASGGSYAAWAAEQVATAAAFGGIVYGIVHFGSELISNKAVPAVLSGPVGGDLLAYGAREMANVDARSMGGTAMPGTETTTVSLRDQQAAQQQFASMSLAQRLFDAGDNRSVIGKLIDSVSLNPQGALASVGNIFTNFSSMFSNSLSSLFPKALASDTGYNWGFPLYGIPDSVAQDPKFQDPYANADQAVQLMQNDSSYIARAKDCFGVAIDPNNNWSVVATTDVNPDSSSYTSSSANCNDTSDNWRRIQLFVMDSRLMDTIACHQGVDDQSCTNLDETGFLASSSASSPGSSSNTNSSSSSGSSSSTNNSNGACGYVSGAYRYTSGPQKGQLCPL